MSNPIAPLTGLFRDFSTDSIGSEFTASGGFTVTGGRLVGGSGAKIQTSSDLASADCVFIATWDTPSVDLNLTLKIREATGDSSTFGMNVESVSGYTHYTVYGQNTGGGYVSPLDAYSSYRTTSPSSSTPQNYVATGVAIRITGGGDGSASSLVETAFRLPSGLWIKQETFSANFGTTAGRRVSFATNANISIQTIGIYPSNAWLVPHTGNHPEAFLANNAYVLDSLDVAALSGMTPAQILAANGQVVSNLAHWTVVPIESGIDKAAVKVSASNPGATKWVMHRRTKSNKTSIVWRTKGDTGVSPATKNHISLNVGYTIVVGVNSTFQLAIYDFAGTGARLYFQTATFLGTLVGGVWYSWEMTIDDGTVRLFCDGVCVSELTNMPIIREEFHVNLPDARFGLSFLGSNFGTGHQDMAIADLLLLDGVHTPAGTPPAARTNTITVSDTAANAIPELGTLHFNALPGADQIQPILASMDASVVRTDKLHICEANVGSSTSTCTYVAPGGVGSQIYVDTTLLDRLIDVANESGLSGLYVGFGGTPSFVGGSDPPVTGSARLTHKFGDAAFPPEVPTNNDHYIGFYKSVFAYLAANYTGTLYVASLNEPGPTFWSGTAAEMATLTLRFYKEVVVPVMGANPLFHLGELSAWNELAGANAVKTYMDAFLDAFDADVSITDTAWNNLIATMHNYDATTQTLEQFKRYIAAKCTALGRPVLRVAGTEDFPGSYAATNTGVLDFGQIGLEGTSNVGVSAWVGRMALMQSYGAKALIHTRSAGRAGTTLDVYESNAVISDGTVWGTEGQIRPLGHLFRMLHRMSKTNAVSVTSDTRWAKTLATKNGGALALLVGNWDIGGKTLSINWPAAAGQTLQAYRVSATENVSGASLVSDGVGITFNGSGIASITMPKESAILLQSGAVRSATIQSNGTSIIVTDTEPFVTAPTLTVPGLVLSPGVPEPAFPTASYTFTFTPTVYQGASVADGLLNGVAIVITNNSTQVAPATAIPPAVTNAAGSLITLPYTAGLISAPKVLTLPGGHTATLTTTLPSTGEQVQWAVSPVIVAGESLAGAQLNGSPLTITNNSTQTAPVAPTQPSVTSVRTILQSGVPVEEISYS